MVALPRAHTPTHTHTHTHIHVACTPNTLRSPKSAAKYDTDLKDLSNLFAQLLAAKRQAVEDVGVPLPHDQQVGVPPPYDEHGNVSRFLVGGRRTTVEEAGWFSEEGRRVDRICELQGGGLSVRNMFLIFTALSDAHSPVCSTKSFLFLVSSLFFSPGR